jgi:septal ring factor EnvC (AmiA/AmiB activator)
LELQEAQVREAETARSLTQAELKRLQADVLDLEVELDRARQDLKGVLIRLYRTGEQGYLRLLLSLESGSQLLDGVRQLRFLAQRDSESVLHFVETHEKLSDRRDSALEKANEVDRWVTRERARRDELERLNRRQVALLARVEREHRQMSVRTTALIERERKLSELIDMLSGRAETPEGISMERYRGVLDPPVGGRVTKGFGPRMDPLYGTRVPHNGLEYSSTAGEEVGAVYGGKVLFAAPFQGYGLTVVVLHAGRVFSLYAGLGELRVAEGDVVTLGDVVGTTSGNLYFEIRVENRPEDPASWLR